MTVPTLAASQPGASLTLRIPTSDPVSPTAPRPAAASVLPAARRAATLVRSSRSSLVAPTGVESLSSLRARRRRCWASAAGGSNICEAAAFSSSRAPASKARLAAPNARAKTLLTSASPPGRSSSPLPRRRKDASPRDRAGGAVLSEIVDSPTCICRIRPYSRSERHCPRFVRGRAPHLLRNRPYRSAGSSSAASS